jgi:hypothetical protein
VWYTLCMIRSTQSPSASHVSRVLAEAGERPLPSGTSRMREGIRVTNSIGYVRVVVDHDSHRESAQRAEVLRDILVGAGFCVDFATDAVLRVTRES